jgi:hypothetical protein
VPWTSFPSLSFTLLQRTLKHLRGKYLACQGHARPFQLAGACRACGCLQCRSASSFIASKTDGGLLSTTVAQEQWQDWKRSCHGEKLEHCQPAKDSSYLARDQALRCQSTLRAL